MKTLALLLLSLGALLLTGHLSARGLPDWAEAPARATLPDEFEDADLVVLWSETVYEFSKRGKYTVRERTVFQILTRDASFSQYAGAFYVKGDRVRSLNAWTRKTNGSVERYKQKEFIDIEAPIAPGTYSEERLLTLPTWRRFNEGDIVAVESVIQTENVLPEFVWLPEEPYPVLQTRLAVELPKRWGIRKHVSNDTLIDEVPTGDPRLWVWEAERLPAKENDNFSPRAVGLGTFVGVDVVPDEKSARRIDFIQTQSWNECATVFAPVTDKHAAPDATILQKARELTEGMDDEAEKLHALARYVQQLRYVFVGLDLNRAGGYIPNPAPEILDRGFGDCKDKTALFRALAQAIGVETYAVSARAGYDFVPNEAWPSPSAFNHAIVALKSDAIDGPAVVPCPALGRLVLFDPTVPSTPLGFLPGSLYHNNVLVNHTDTTGLLATPPLPPEQVSRAITVDLRKSGSALVSIEEEFNLRSAEFFRRRSGDMTSKDFNDFLIRRASDSMNVDRIDEVGFVDHFIENRFELAYKIEALLIARPLGTGLLVLNPDLFPRYQDILAGDEIDDRQQPLAFNEVVISDSILVRLPDGVAVDELPPALNEENDFASMQADYRIDADGNLVIERTFALKDILLEVTEFDRVKEFFARKRVTDRAAVVLARVPDSTTLSAHQP